MSVELLANVLRFVQEPAARFYRPGDTDDLDRSPALPPYVTAVQSEGAGAAQPDRYQRALRGLVGRAEAAAERRVRRLRRGAREGRSGAVHDRRDKPRAGRDLDAEYRRRYHPALQAARGYRASA